MSLTQSGILREIPIGVSMEEIDRVEESILRAKLVIFHIYSVIIKNF